MYCETSGQAGVDVTALDGETFDAVVIGAGPAGCVAAAILSARGWRVLLVEKSNWPRAKVCGGCLNAIAVNALRNAGLGAALRGSVPIHRAVWHVNGRSMAVETPGGAAILRNEFDAALVEQFKSRGGAIIHDCTASLGGADSDSSRTIHLRRRGIAARISSRITLACDGLSGTSLANEPWADWRMSNNSLMGVSIAAPLYVIPVDAAPIPAGAVCMYVGCGGYVGLVRLADGRIHLAAAIHPGASRRAGGPAALVASILDRAGAGALPGLMESRLNGIGAITRHRKTLGAHRVLAIGDACGYDEPFTGEGIGRAIAGAVAAVNLLPHSATDWSASIIQQWQSAHEAMRSKGRLLRILMTPALRHPAIANAALRLAILTPSLADLVARQFSAPHTESFGEFA